MPQLFSKSSFHLRPTHWVLLVFAVVALWAGHNMGRWKNSYVIRWDASGYYFYLPAAFIYHDLSKGAFLPEVSPKYRPADNEFYYAMLPLDNGKAVCRYPVGIALLELPFFAMAHTYARLSTYPPDGWSLPYQVGILLSGIFYGCLGLYFLGKLLSQLVSNNIAALVLFALAFGTNFFYYSIIEGGMSHVYLFFLYAFTLYYSLLWHEHGHQLRHLIAIAVGIAWASICRPTEIILLLIPLLYGISDRQSLQQRLQILWQHRHQLLIGLVAGFVVVLPQLLYWKLTSNSFLFYSYGDVGFDFRHPHLIDGLFSYRKGWFLYTPLALLVPIGIILLPFFSLQSRIWSLSMSIFFILCLYLTFSWSIWAYGGSFGSRPMVQTLALFSIPIAYLVHYCFQKSKTTAALLSILILCCVSLNLFQTHQYQKGILVWDNMNKAYYWRVFGKTSVTEEDRKLLEWW